MTEIEAVRAARVAQQADLRRRLEIVFGRLAELASSSRPDRRDRALSLIWMALDCVPERSPEYVSLVDLQDLWLGADGATYADHNLRIPVEHPLNLSRSRVPPMSSVGSPAAMCAGV